MWRGFDSNKKNEANVPELGEARVIREHDNKRKTRYEVAREDREERKAKEEEEIHK